MFVKLHKKATYGASGFCETYTRKTPLYIYYLISKTANAACIILAFWYYVIVPIRCEHKRKGGRNDKRMNRTRSEARKVGSIAHGPQRGNTGQRIHCKGGEQKMRFIFRCAIVGAVIMAGFLLSALIR